MVAEERKEDQASQRSFIVQLISYVALEVLQLRFSLTMKTSFDVLEGQSFHEPEAYGIFNTLGY